MDWYINRDLTERTKITTFSGEEIEIDLIKQRWAAGRIDILGTEEEYPEEISVPLMLGSDWIEFNKWLTDFGSEEVLTLDQLVENYELTNPKITWWKDKDSV